MSLHHHTEGPPAQQFRAALLAELLNGVTKVRPASVEFVFRITPPDGVVRKFGFVPVNGGEGRIASVDWPTHAVNIFQDDFSSPEMVVKINDDEARSFAILAAKYPRTLPGSPTEGRLVSKAVTSPDDEFFFPGIVDSVGLEAPGLWAVRCRPNNRPLSDGYFLTEKVGSQFPNAHASAKGQALPWVFGEHSSVGIGGNGSVDCLYVDTVGWRYLPTAGRAEAVDAVYGDGVLIAPSNYTVLQETYGGLWTTIIKFTSDQLEKVITCDIRGLTDRGDGTGTLIRNRVPQMLHFLVNRVWNNWRQGPYYSETTAPLDLESFARSEAFLAQVSDPEGADVFLGAEPQRCAEKFRQQLQSSKLKAFWTPAWKLAVKPLDIYQGPYVAEGDPVDLDVYAKEAIAVPGDVTGLVRTLSVQHLYHQAEGAYKGSLTVADLSVPHDLTEGLELPGGSARVK